MGFVPESLQAVSLDFHEAEMQTELNFGVVTSMCVAIDHHLHEVCKPAYTEVTCDWGPVVRLGLTPVTAPRFMSHVL